MANIAIWGGSSTFTAGTTPFGFYDTDTEFQTDADKVSKFCASRLGFPLMDVELDSGSFYTCFEEAVTTYGNEVFKYKIRENYLGFEGASTGSTVNSRVLEPSLSKVIQISEHYGSEAGVGGNFTLYTGSVPLTASIQQYNLNDWATEEGITGKIDVRKVFYEAPPAIQRYFDPYAGTGTGIQSLMDQFGFGSMSPGINFMLMPVSYDMQLIQAIEFNDQVRKSAYSFEIINNNLKIFPIPNNAGKLFIEYYKEDEKNVLGGSDSLSTISNVAEVPYENPTYSYINSVGRQWIFNYTLALAKEMLAYIRGKYTTVPIPGSETTLNQADLLGDARTEKLALITDLRDTLSATSRQTQLEGQAKEVEDLQTTLRAVPMTIFVG